MVKGIMWYDLYQPGSEDQIFSEHLDAKAKDSELSRFESIFDRASSLREATEHYVTSHHKRISAGARNLLRGLDFNLIPLEGTDPSKSVIRDCQDRLQLLELTDRLLTRYGPIPNNGGMGKPKMSTPLLQHYLSQPQKKPYYS